MTKNTAPAVPLVCSLCPKKPVFSDKSHLLTHISSKAHLCFMFKLQLRAQTESDAREQMEEYNAWYAEHGLGELLSERLAVKESKNSSRRHRQSGGPGQVGGSKPLIKADDSKVSVKKEKATTSATLYESPTYAAPVAIMQAWASTPQKDPSTPLPRGRKMSNQYETPTAQRSIPNFLSEDAVAHRTRSASTKAPRTPTPRDDHIVFRDDKHDFDIDDHIDDHAVVTPEVQRPPEMDQLWEKLIDNSKLKGVRWPGMTLFDSATAEMRRQRNQKKSQSVVAEMQDNSTKVVPDEWIFRADGSFDRKRNMYGPSADNSPVQAMNAATPRPRKKRTTKKASVADLDDDSDLFGSPAPPKRRGRPVRKQQSTATLSAGPPMSVFQPAKFEPSTEEASEFRQAVKGMGKKPFEVFRDISPGRTESPLEAMKFDRPDSGLSNPDFNFPAFSNDGININDFSTGGYINDMPSPISRVPLLHMTSNVRQPFPSRFHSSMGGGAFNDQPFGFDSYMGDHHGSYMGGLPPHVFQNSGSSNPFLPALSLADMESIFRSDENAIPFAGFGPPKARNPVAPTSDAQPEVHDAVHEEYEVATAQM